MENKNVLEVEQQMRDDLPDMQYCFPQLANAIAHWVLDDRVHHAKKQQARIKRLQTLLKQKGKK